jgi:hypothetical protein
MHDDETGEGARISLLDDRFEESVARLRAYVAARIGDDEMAADIARTSSSAAWHVADGQRRQPRAFEVAERAVDRRRCQPLSAAAAARLPAWARGGRAGSGRSDGRWWGASSASARVPSTNREIPGACGDGLVSR